MVRIEEFYEFLNFQYCFREKRKHYASNWEEWRQQLRKLVNENRNLAIQCILSDRKPKEIKFLIRTQEMLHEFAAYIKEDNAEGAHKINVFSSQNNSAIEEMLKLMLPEAIQAFFSVPDLVSRFLSSYPSRFTLKLLVDKSPEDLRSYFQTEL